MGASLATVSGALKEIYEGKINSQVNEEAVALKRLDKSSDGVTDTVGGKYVTFPIRTQRNAGISYRPEGAQLAPPGQQGYAAAQVPLKYGYGRFQFTGQTMELADSNFQAFADMADEEMDRLKADLVKDSNRVAYQNPNGNGVLTMITDTATSVTHTVNNPQYLEPGMVVDVLVAASGSATGGIQSTNTVPVKVVSINESTNAVTFDTSFGPTTTGHAVYRFGNRNNEPTGLSQIVATAGSLHNIDPAIIPLWKGNLINNTAAPGTAIALAESKMILACDTARKKGGKTSAIFTSLGVRRAYFNLLTQQRRYTDPRNYPGGFVGLPFNYGTEVPTIEDPDAPPNKMWFIDESKIRIYRRKDWYFDDTQGILRWVRDYDIYEGLAKSYREMGTSQRNAHTLYDDVLEG